MSEDEGAYYSVGADRELISGSSPFSSPYSIDGSVVDGNYISWGEEVKKSFGYSNYSNNFTLYIYYIDEYGCYRRNDFAQPGASFRMYIYNNSGEQIELNGVEDDEIIIDFENQLLYVNDISYDLTQLTMSSMNYYPKIKKVVGLRMG